jgi:N-acetylglucosaminyldiphosphoundecaprenol N-acetyl-beta-D-mannosaminyltransferase
MKAALSILGVPIHDVDFNGACAQVAAWLDEPGARQIATVNPEFIMTARRDPAFAAALRHADLNVPDGVGVLWAARRLGRPLRERVGGADLMLRLCERAAAAGWRVFLLGAGAGVAARAAEILTGRYPGLVTCGTHAGSPADGAATDITARIRAARPQLLFVAYGAPAQDLWLSRNLSDCLSSGIQFRVIGMGWRVIRLPDRCPEARAGVGAAGRAGVVVCLLRQPWRLRRQMALPALRPW